MLYQLRNFKHLHYFLIDLYLAYGSDRIKKLQILIKKISEYLQTYILTKNSTTNIFKPLVIFNTSSLI